MNTLDKLTDIPWIIQQLSQVFGSLTKFFLEVFLHSLCKIRPNNEISVTFCVTFAKMSSAFVYPAVMLYCKFSKTWIINDGHF